MDWYDRAVEEIENDHQEGHLSDSEYLEAMRDLNAEFEQGAQDAASEAYDNYCA